MKVQGELTKLVASMAKTIRTITPSTAVLRLRTVRDISIRIRLRCEAELSERGASTGDDDG